MQSLSDWLANSSYGKLTSIIRQVFNVDESASQLGSSSNNSPLFNLSFIHLPRIIVVGTEASGKSTLMQRITSRKYFPHNSELGTKCPTILRLVFSPTPSYTLIWRGTRTSGSHDKAITKKVKDIMDALEGHVEDELIIEIKGPDLPNFELIDLPGLVAVPGPAADKTRNIVNKYLRDPDTLVLCVVSAVTERLNSNLAVAKVIEMRKQKETILCLTKCDSVNADNFDLLVVKRVMMANEMRELNGTPFAGVVATANLNREDMTRESQFFKQMLETISADHLHSRDLLPKMNSENIIRILDDFYHRHITETWCPNVLKRIQEMIHREEAALAALGKPVSEIDAQIVWQEARQLLLNLVFENVKNSVCALFRQYRETLSPERVAGQSRNQYTNNSYGYYQNKHYQKGHYQNGHYQNGHYHKEGRPIRQAMSIEEINTVQRFFNTLDKMASDFSSSLTETSNETSSTETASVSEEKPNISQVVATVTDTSLRAVFGEQRTSILRIGRFQHLLSLLSNQLKSEANSVKFNVKNVNQLLTKIQRSKCDITSCRSGTPLYYPQHESLLQLFDEIEMHALIIFQLEANRLVSSLDEYVASVLKDNKDAIVESADVVNQRRIMSSKIALWENKCRNIQELGEFQLSKKQSRVGCPSNK